ncbi:hypothetical protein Taro_055760 [Colocasia esculenta]|uniref:Uncharacterized protein n=1 Tax=Colocasia esculenta TaxID=4460 RepID=A0A843XS55_COLES|nr:hypothetical protein [Colocasia esculenta]
MGLQLCVCRCGVGWSPQLFDFFVVERQLDLSSVTARLRVCDSWSRFDQFEVCPGVGTVSSLRAFSTCAESSRNHVDFLPVGLVVDGLFGSSLSAPLAVFIAAHIPSKIATLDEGLNFVLKLAALGGVVAVVAVEAIVLFLVASSGVGVHPWWPPNIGFVPDFYQDLFGRHYERGVVSEGVWLARRIPVAPPFLPITVGTVIGRPLFVRRFSLLYSAGN